MTVPIFRPLVRDWYCPACGQTARLPMTKPKQTHMHTCPKLRYLSAPMLPSTTAAKVEIVERGDYVGKETVQLDPDRGRPVQSIVTTRDNGQDAIIFAPVAAARARIE